MAAAWEPLGRWMAWLGEASFHASVLIVLVLAAQRLLGRWLSARWRHALWLLVLARLALPAAPQAPCSVFGLTEAAAKHLRGALGWADPAGPGPEAGGAAGRRPGLTAMVAASPPGPSSAAGAMPREATWPGALLGVLAAAWAAGAAGLLARLVICSARFGRRLPSRFQPADPEPLSLLGECCLEMGVRRTPALIETDAVGSPALFGLLQPRLLLPAGLVDCLTQEELRHVFRHELAHLKRRDVPLEWLAAGLCAVHWFNPLVWLALRRMRADRELACDELVLARTRGRDARGYGWTIVKLLEAVSRPARQTGVVGVAEATSQAHRRIRMIASFGKNRRWRSVLGAVLAMVLAAGAMTDAASESPAAPEPHTPVPGAFLAPASWPAATRPATPGGRKAQPQVFIETKFLTASPALFGAARAEWQTLVQPADEGLDDAPRGLARRRPRLVQPADEGQDDAAKPDGPPVAGQPVGRAEWTVHRPLMVRWATLDDQQVGRMLDQARRAKSHLLCSPVLMTEDGQQACVMTGEKVPYITDYTAKTSADGTTTLEPVVKYLMQGTSLTVRATLREDRKSVALELEPRITEIVGWTEVPYCGRDGKRTDKKIRLPEMANKRIRCAAEVAEGTTFALCGLPAAPDSSNRKPSDQEILVLVKARRIRPSDLTKPTK